MSGGCPWRTEGGLRSSRLELDSCEPILGLQDQCEHWPPSLRPSTLLRFETESLTEFELRLRDVPVSASSSLTPSTWIFM